MTLRCVGIRRYFILLGSAALFVLLAAGCESTTNAGGTAASQDTSLVGAAEPEESQAQNVLFTGAVIDTLAGSASYGLVMDPRTRTERFVIKLSSVGDFTGGVFITRVDTTLPDRGTYQLGNLLAEDANIAPDQFIVVHRKGLDRFLKSTSGTLTLDAVTDTLITGTLDATLRGWVVSGGTMQEDQEVHVRGEFEAENGDVGYIIGL